MTLEKLQYFFERAAECERLARKARDSKSCEMFLYIASSWRTLAAVEERNRIQPQQGDNEPLPYLD
jgi:hypothetical protein